MPHTTPVLQADGLSFGHGHSTLFAHLSVLLPAGVTLVCGDEGVGKTTLLQLLAGVLPTTGQLQIRGLRLADRPGAYRQQVSWFDVVWKLASIEAWATVFLDGPPPTATNASAPISRARS